MSDILQVKVMGALWHFGPLGLCPAGPFSNSSIIYQAVLMQVQAVRLLRKSR